MEENTALRGKLTESRVRTFRVETCTRNEPRTSTPAQKAEVPNTVDATLSHALKGLHVNKSSQQKKGQKGLRGQETIKKRALIRVLLRRELLVRNQRSNLR